MVLSKDYARLALMEWLSLFLSSACVSVYLVEEGGKHYMKKKKRICSESPVEATNSVRFLSKKEKKKLKLSKIK